MSQSFVTLSSPTRGWILGCFFVAVIHNRKCPGDYTISSRKEQPRSLGIHLVIREIGPLVWKKGQFESFPDFWRVLRVPGDSWVFVQCLSGLPPRVRRGQKTMFSGILKLLLLHLKQASLFVTWFAYWILHNILRKGFCCLKKRKKKKEKVFKTSSLCTLWFCILAQPWQRLISFSMKLENAFVTGPNPQTELIFTKLPGFLRRGATDLARLYKAFLLVVLYMASFKISTCY